MSIEDELQAAAERDALVIGTEETVKAMDRLDRVVVASNAPGDIVDEVAAAAEEAGVEVGRVEADNQELGSLCMKPFAASVVGME
ncbi:MAG: ribosomal L7Ae/L30e/S12e/Gadd45 family protein [Candidatus Nanohaloarchaea archaeon]|nr:ribosomal L7Ae/L30e/S12e/Gadd45 family protein [Candidatus Nanohaloarchaea archaeon]